MSSQVINSDCSISVHLTVSDIFLITNNIFSLKNLGDGFSELLTLDQDIKSFGFSFDPRIRQIWINSGYLLILQFSTSICGFYLVHNEPVTILYISADCI